jgi:hypothetical protein
MRCKVRLPLAEEQNNEKSEQSSWATQLRECGVKRQVKKRPSARRAEQEDRHEKYLAKRKGQSYARVL